jgi:hypothetical protein
MRGLRDEVIVRRVAVATTDGVKSLGLVGGRPHHLRVWRSDARP